MWDLKLLSVPTSSPNLSIRTTPGRTSVVGSGAAVSGSGSGPQQGIRRNRRPHRQLKSPAEHRHLAFSGAGQIIGQ